MIDRLKWIEFNWIDVKIYNLVIITFACFLAWIIAKVSEQVFYGSFCANLESSLARCFLWPAHMWRFSNRTCNQEAPLGACKSFIINKLPVSLFSPSIPNNKLIHTWETTGNQSFIGGIESRLGLPFGFVGDFWIPLAKICFFHFIRRFYHFV